MIRQALLTLLRAGPKYGYQLKSEFEDATGTAWLLNIGQVYTTLGRMQRDGVVIEQAEAGETSGSDDERRQRYEITVAGIDELDTWLAGAVERSTSTRDEVTMKVLMAAATGVVDPGTPIGVQRAASTALVQQATLARNAATSLPDRLHLERLIQLTAAELRWLDVAEAALAEIARAEAPQAAQSPAEERDDDHAET